MYELLSINTFKTVFIKSVYKTSDFTSTSHRTIFYVHTQNRTLNTMWENNTLRIT